MVNRKRVQRLMRLMGRSLRRQRRQKRDPFLAFGYRWRRHEAMPSPNAKNNSAPVAMASIRATSAGRSGPPVAASPLNEPRVRCSLVSGRSRLSRRSRAMRSSACCPSNAFRARYRSRYPGHTILLRIVSKVAFRASIRANSRPRTGTPRRRRPRVRWPAHRSRIAVQMNAGPIELRRIDGRQIDHRDPGAGALLDQFGAQRIRESADRVLGTAIGRLQRDAAVGQR